MEAFKVRLIQEYNELNERIGKLSNFLKNPNGVELSEKMMAVMGGQQVAMEEYSRKLWERTETSVATNYVPDWNDMFAKDWMVL